MLGQLSYQVKFGYEFRSEEKSKHPDKRYTGRKQYCGAEFAPEERSTFKYTDKIGQILNLNLNHTFLLEDFNMF